MNFFENESHIDSSLNKNINYNNNKYFVEQGL